MSLFRSSTHSNSAFKEIGSSLLRGSAHNSATIEEIGSLLEEAGEIFISDEPGYYKRGSGECIKDGYDKICSLFYNSDNFVLNMNVEFKDSFGDLEEDDYPSELVASLASRIWGIALGIALYKSAQIARKPLNEARISDYVDSAPHKSKYRTEILKNVKRTLHLLAENDELQELIRETGDTNLQATISTSKDLARIYFSLIDGDQSFVDTGHYADPFAVAFCWKAIWISFVDLDITKASKEFQKESLF